MYIRSTLGAIFALFIFYVHCDNAANYNEVTRIYVPSAPQNLTANRVTSDEIHLSWAPPLTTTTRELNPDLSVVPKKKERDGTQADEPVNDVIDNLDSSDMVADSPITLKDFDYNWYKNEKLKYDESDTLRNKRELRSHRHRKRRQNNVTDVKTHTENDAFIQNGEIDLPIEVVKKSFTPVVPLRDPTQIAYVLYYEQGVPRSDTSTIFGVQSSADVKKKNVFPSDLGMEQYSRATKNLTLLNTSGVVTKVVGFRLKNLKPFTPYKIWVRAFYNFSLDGVKSSELVGRLGPSATPLYALTDVKPPSAPTVLNLTCDQPQGILYLQWRQPQEFNNSLDQYVVTLRKIPELQPRTRLTLPTNKNDIETTIMVNVDLSNVTRYEVKLFAVTLSVAKPNTLINGSESPPEEVSSQWCVAHSAAMSPETAPARGMSALLMLLVPCALLAATGLTLVYWRCRSRLSKCISAAYNYLEEGGERAARAPLNVYKKPVVNCSPLVSCGATAPEPETVSSHAKPPRMSGSLHPAVKALEFPAHVMNLHRDSDVGFSKEYEIVVSRSAALGHTSHHSHRPENRLKNRYLNITAYDHSRVCVSAGGRCGASGCVGAGRGAACDYVNANFIDGMLPALTASAKRRLRRKLDRRNKPQRQPSVKPSKPPPVLAEGIESAFLNIEFSGIVESDDGSDSSESDRDSELDDVYIDLDGAQTRVKLEWLLWRRRYIATQGPTPATLDAFWRMIWQHRVHTIVMITNLVERGRRKCDMYWPDGGRGSSATYGGVHVVLEREEVRAAYTVRRLSARSNQREARAQDSDAESPLSEDGVRTVIQYHYTVWPDHGTPRHPLQVLPFVRAANRDKGPVLVHCSAGVGRTGTYIVLDAQLNQLRHTGTLSPLGFLCRARTQRNHLVQTEEQYVFVHDALLEHVRSGDTDVEFTKAREYLAKILEPISDEELAVLDVNSPKKPEDLTNGNSSTHTNGLSTNISTNGIENDDTTSIKSIKSTKSTKSVKSSKSTKSHTSEKEILENGTENGSMSIKTDELNSDSKSSRNSDSKTSRDLEEVEQKEVLVNGEETEGVYDLAPRSTDTYSKKMAMYNSLSDQEKEEIRRANRAENYALLERMRSLANRHHSYQGPPPVNLLEKQYLLITRSAVEPSLCARAAHNVEKNRLGGVLPSDSARVMLVPKPGVEGSDYINASWVCGRRRMREYAVTQHPPACAAADLWRLLWDHCAQLVLLLTDPKDPECEPFWPTEEDKELFIANFKASFVSKETYVAYRKCDRQVTPATAPSEPETHQTNGLRRQESDCADDERLIPENSPVQENEPSYKFDRTELRLERLSANNKDLSTRKSIANGDLFSSFQEKKNGPKSPKSPSKMSLKSFKLPSPCGVKWGSLSIGSPPPPTTAPPPRPAVPTVQEEAEMSRPTYYYQMVDEVPESISPERVVEVINVSVHSLQDDYQLSVKFIKCSHWLEGHTTDYTPGKPENNEYITAVRNATTDSERETAIDRLIEPYKDAFGLVEFVAGCQMEYKNGPVVVVDKYGGSKAMSFCTLSAAAGGLREPSADSEDGAPEARGSLYTCAALAAHARCGTHQQPITPGALLAQYAALAHLPRLTNNTS